MKGMKYSALTMALFAVFGTQAQEKKENESRAYREGSLGLAVCPHKAEHWEAHARSGDEAALH